jgi:cytidylate kinase
MAARVPVITIDGPGASGKGTVARLLAARLGWHLLDSGALYRAVALAALEGGLALDQPKALATLAAELPLRFEEGEGETHIWLGERCVDAELRAETTGEAASQVAAHPEVRAALLQLQRAFARAPGLVADGRDMGTVVFGDAPYKFFLTAAPEERARRRHKQLKQKGISVSLPALAAEIADRDRRDSERSTAPLKPAEDAFRIDSTRLSAEAVVAIVLAQLAESGLSVPAAD